MYHDNSGYGENLAYSYGKSDPDTDYVLQRWVEEEEKLPYPKNGHYTQVLWRATEYVGCADVGVLVRGKSDKERVLRRNNNGKNNNRPGRGKAGRPNNNGRPGNRPKNKPGRPSRGKVAKNAKVGKRGKNGKENDGGKGGGGGSGGGKGQNGSKAGKDDPDDGSSSGGSFKCYVQVCRYARYAFECIHHLLSCCLMLGFSADTFISSLQCTI